MTPHLLALLAHYGLLIVLVNVLLDQLGLPVPAVPTLIVAGSLAAAGRLSAPELFAGSVAACLLADCVWFLIGRNYGIRVLKTLCRISLEPDYCVSQTQGRFERWGVNSLLVAKFVPGLAIIAPPLAGALRIGWARFLLLSAGGAALWVTVGLGAGMMFASQVERMFADLQRVGSIAIVGIASAFGAYLLYKWNERRRFFAQLRMARIGVDDLYRLMEAGKGPLIVDVRTHTARLLDPRRIPGAIHTTIEEVGERIAELPQDREIIVYCACPNEASAARVAKQLMNHGFKRVRPLHGGLDAWVAAGYEVETYAAPP